MEYAWRFIALFFLYLLSARIGLSLSAFVEGNVTLLWLPSGIALSMLLLLGRRYWPAIALGAFVVTALTRVPLPVALGMAIGARACACWPTRSRSAWAATRWPSSPPAHGHLFAGSTSLPVKEAVTSPQETRSVTAPATATAASVGLGATGQLGLGAQGVQIAGSLGAASSGALLGARKRARNPPALTSSPGRVGVASGPCRRSKPTR